MPSFAGERPDVSGIYRFLKSMESKGLVVSSWDTPGKGHAKRLYEITAAGESCLARWVENLDDYLKAVKALLKTAKAAVARQPKKRAGSSAKRSQRPTAPR